MTHRRKDTAFAARIAARADELRAQQEPRQPAWARLLFLFVTRLVYRFVHSN